jgi:hypothetical protein
MLGGHESPVALEQAVAVPACLKDRGVHRSTTRRGSSGPDLGIIDTLQRLIHAAASFASFFVFRGLSINESTFCFIV